MSRDAATDNDGTNSDGVDTTGDAAAAAAAQTDNDGTDSDGIDTGAVAPVDGVDGASGDDSD